MLPSLPAAEYESGDGSWVEVSELMRRSDEEVTREDSEFEVPAAKMDNKI